jgi:hypothetical protein
MIFDKTVAIKREIVNLYYIGAGDRATTRYCSMSKEG